MKTLQHGVLGNLSHSKPPTIKNKRNDVKDRTGERFGHLVLIKSARRQYQNRWRTVWECRCDCGTLTTALYFNLLQGSQRSCGCSRLEYIVCPEPSKKIALAYYGLIRKNAEKRNLEFNVSIEFLYQLFLKQEGKCKLSGMKIELPSRYLTKTKNANIGSLDRINSSIGYIEGNVQWVHKDINVMKMHLSQDYFIKLCGSIAAYNKES